MTEFLTIKQPAEVVMLVLWRPVALRWERGLR
jgi:hypothetical protein